MEETRVKWLLRVAREQIGKISVAVIAATVSALALSNLHALKEWLTIDIPLGIAVISVAWGTTASVYLLIQKRRMRAMRTSQTGILWQQHEGLLFKIEVLRKGSRLSESRVVGLYCETCKSRAEVWTNMTPDGPRGHVIYCPSCNDFSDRISNAEDVLKRIVESIVEGRINRGELTVDSKSIEWLDSGL